MIGWCSGGWPKEVVARLIASGAKPAASALSAASS